MNPIQPGALFTPYARIGHVWQTDVLLQWNAQGTLTRVQAQIDPQSLPSIPALQRAVGPVLPGMPNLHSHAFQSAMAGLTEYRAQAADSFWSWRELMYRFAARILPDDMAAIARYLYIEMLKAGYTSVCEFHYVHHQPDGSPHPHRAALAARVVDAAARTGIGITMLPVLYQYGNFGQAVPHPGQRRFLNEPEQLLAMLRELNAAFPETEVRRYGVAPHSLRAVSETSLRTLLDGLQADFPGAPIHIHIAEQTAELDACIDWCGARPVQWLMDHFDVDPRWCLVHATHVDAEEVARMARSGAITGLCPSTEANLGDGVFPAVDYLRQGGRFGVGSDSHICVSWPSELRLLEYGQRLLHRQRNILASDTQLVVAERLFDAAIAGGAQATGLALGALRVGSQADFLVLDPNHTALASQPIDSWLSGLVFSERGGFSPIRDVYVAGRRCIHNGHHPDEAEATRRYRATLQTLLSTE